MSLVRTDSILAIVMKVACTDSTASPASEEKKSRASGKRRGRGGGERSGSTVEKEEVSFPQVSSMRPRKESCTPERTWQFCLKMAGSDLQTSFTDVAVGPTRDRGGSVLWAVQ